MLASKMKFIPLLSASFAVGVLDSLGGSPGREIAYLLTGKTPAALNPAVMLRGVIAWLHASASSCET